MLTKAFFTHIFVAVTLLLSQQTYAVRMAPQLKATCQVYLLSATDKPQHLENLRNLCHIPQLQEGKRQTRTPAQQHSINVLYSQNNLITIPFITDEYHDARKKLLSLVFFSTRLQRAPPASTYTHA